jgi:hypothetical protein
MRKLEKNTKNIVVNLFADFVLSKIDKKEKSIIEVIDCGPFFIVNGITSSKEVLDLNSIQDEFCLWFDDHLSIYENKTFNLIDIIKYNQEVLSNDYISYTVNKNIYEIKKRNDEIISTKSEFPYGYSLGSGRSIYYYYLYILNQISSTIGVKEMDINLIESIDREELDLKINCNSIYSNETIKNLILDVFDFDLEKFNQRFDEYEFYEDVLFQNNEKPYMVQDRLKDVIIF